MVARGLLAERASRRCKIVGIEAHQLRALQAGEPVTADSCEPQCLSIERLLEQCPCEARVSETLVARRSGENPPQLVARAVAEDVLVVARERSRDLDELVGRIVGERDLAREAGA